MAAHQHLSCVLLAEERQLDPAAISGCHKRLFEAAGMTVGTSDGDFTVLRTKDVAVSYVAAMPAPVPNGEAEFHRKYSLESILGGPAIEGHRAHILVITRSESSTNAESLKTHLRNTAAVAKAHGGIAVYDGSAGATHSVDFYVDQVRRDALPVAVISGLSVVNEGDEGLSVLTLGLRQLGIRELVAAMPRKKWKGGIDFVLNLASYVIDRGQQVPDGDTVGYGEMQRLEVSYRSSPLDPKEQVAFVSLPFSTDASTTVEALLVREIDRITQPELRALAQSLRVPLHVEERPWDYGHEGQAFSCWIAFAHPPSNTVIAYCSEGFGPACPWGLLFLAEPRNMGMDSQWFVSVEDALRNCPAWTGENPPGYEVQ